MKLGFFSDIHANLRALESVLADARRQGVNELVSLGDIVGYGPRPLECLERVLDSARWLIAGNHDLMAGDPDIPLSGLREDVADGLLYARNALDEEQLAAMLAMPVTCMVHGVACSHASLYSAETFHYIHTQEEAAQHFKALSVNMSFFGHTHQPMGWVEDAGQIICYMGQGRLQVEAGRRYAINVGSVGQPRDGDYRACYVTYDVSTGMIEWRRVGYDAQTTVTEMISLGMPESSANRLLTGT